MINRLIDIIGREASLFESFLTLFEKQQDMLVTNDADGLHEVTERLREKVIESRQLNKQREELVERIRLDNQIEGDLNVTRLLEIVDDEQATQLIRLRELITSLNDKIATTRNQNAVLLNQSREYINKMMGMLSKLSHPEPAYSSTGSGDQQAYNVALDRRA
ncbi:MAG: flagellar protein FlgN [candidate division Zixibacteria bacterium]|nr:flagellar protein FlgN [candidate division Zixibacteria bacterium]MDH3938630.1 flagellar protein FlgN [candidate division Zixibacteria bacterium]